MAHLLAQTLDSVSGLGAEVSQLDNVGVTVVILHMNSYHEPRGSMCHSPCHCPVMVRCRVSV